jgi:arylesterase/paraoxonase
MLVTGAVALTLRMLIASGVFTTVTPGFEGTCRAITGIVGAEDIAVDRQTGTAFISATNRPAKAHGTPDPQDGLYAMALSGGIPVKLAGAPKDFHPHGISLFRAADGSLTLMAINHRRDGTSGIDIFAVDFAGGKVALHENGAIESGRLVSPNAIAAVDQDRFYITNDHTSATPWGRWLDDNFVIPRANILFFDGSVFKVVADDLVFPSGAAVSHDGRYLYVSESYNRQLRTYERGPLSGTLQQVSVLAIPSDLDNSNVDADGNIWIGSHPKAFAMANFRTDIAKPAPSEIFEVTVKDGIPQDAKLVYANMGDEIGASSVGVVSGKTLLIGSAYDRKILTCTMR